MKIINFCKDDINGNVFFEIAANIAHCLVGTAFDPVGGGGDRKKGGILKQKGHL